MTSTSIELLQGMAIFGALSSDTLSLILEHSREVEFAPEEFVFAEDESGDTMYVIERGKVAVLKAWQGSNRKLAELGPGDCFGEMALLEIARRNASCQSIDSTTALEIPIDALSKLYERDLEQFALIQMNMGREVSRRLRIADERILRAALGADVSIGSEYLYLT